MPGEVTRSSKTAGPVRLVVFDLDGTLIDSIADIAASANQAMVEAYGDAARLPQDVVRGFVGGGARQLIERCLAASSQPPEDQTRIFERFLVIYGSRLTATTRLYPGMEKALDQIARSATMAVLTNKPGAITRVILRDLGLSHRFVAIIGGDDLPSRKPDPEGFLKIAREAGACAEESALVGDSAIDVLTARNAGARAIGVLWGYDRAGVEREGPDVMVERPSDLAPSLA